MSTFFAGLAGVLAAPIIGLEAANFTLLIAATFAAVIAARLRNLPIAVGVGLLMGIATSLIQRYLPPASNWTAEIIDAVPFIVIAVLLIYNLIRRGRVGETDGWGGPSTGPSPLKVRAGWPVRPPRAVETGSLGFRRPIRRPGGPRGPGRRVAHDPLGLLGGPRGPGLRLRGHLPVLDPGHRGGGHALAVPDHLRRGRGPHHGPAGQPRRMAHPGRRVVGGLVALAMGAIVGFLSIRLGDLYVALVTLTFGLLIENLVFTLPSFLNQGLGLLANRPGFAASDGAFSYLCLVAFILVALFIVNFRRSTTGLALNAARWSEAGARTTGISVVQMKVIAGALAAFVAGIGGGLLATAQTTFQPSEFATFAGIVWLAVLVTIGVRSNAAALVAGLTFVMLPALSQAYLPTWTANVLPVLFGLGAIAAAKYPDGVLAEQSRRLRRLVLHLTPTRPGELPLTDGVAAEATGAPPVDRATLVAEQAS